MTAPLAGTGLEVSSDAPPSVPEAPAFDYFGYPTNSTTAGTVAWLRRRGGRADETPLVVGVPSNLSTKALVVAGDGRWVRRYQKHSNDEVWAVQNGGPGFAPLTGGYSALGDAAAQSPIRVIRFIEALRFIGTLNASARFVHGFYVGDQNLLVGGGPTGTGPFAGFGILWNVSGLAAFDMFVKQPSMMPTWQDVGLGDLAAAGFVRIEHRLYLPGVSEDGRYELFLNGVRRGTIAGADLPVPTNASHAARPLYAYSNNAGAGGTPGTETLWTRIIAGDEDIISR